MPSILNIATSGLLAYQKALSTTGHNIANVNTEGYSRQIVGLEARAPTADSGGFVGAGVQTSTIQRVYDNFLGEELRVNISAEKHFQSFSTMSARLEDLLAETDRGLSSQFENFFTALQDVSNNPSAIPERQVLIGEANALALQFRQLDDAMDALNAQVNDQLQGMILEINSIAKSLAQINNDIDAARASAAGQPPNDLLDQRDVLLARLSEYTGLVTTFQDDGAVNVLVGSGQILVVGNQYQQLSLSTGDFDPLSTNINVNVTGGTSVPITDSITGGAMYGLLRFREEVLVPARRELGLLAVGLAETFNDQHKLGLDVTGAVGGDFFNAIPPTVANNFNNVGNASVTASLVDASSLSATDYKMLFDGATWFLTNQKTGAVTSAANGSFDVDGLEIRVASGAASAGDSFLIRPNYRAASAFTVAITEPGEVAAAMPVVASAPISNSGTARISGLTNASMTNIPLGANITLTYDSDAAAFQITGGPGGSLAYNASTESGGKSFTLAGYGDLTFNISGVPQDGDTLVLSNNTNGSGDNRNALALAELQRKGTLIGGTASYQETFNGTIGSIGIQVRQAEASLATQTALRDQAEQSLNSIAGVNLDEEAANLLKYQQAYQASAQVVVAANQMFQTLLDAFR
jgi:flagellar hook-associated protein 1 FlgK